MMLSLFFMMISSSMMVSAMDMMKILSKIPDSPLEPFDDVDDNLDVSPLELSLCFSGSGVRLEATTRKDESTISRSHSVPR